MFVSGSSSHANAAITTRATRVETHNASDQMISEFITLSCPQSSSRSFPCAAGIKSLYINVFMRSILSFDQHKNHKSGQILHAGP